VVTLLAVLVVVALTAALMVATIQALLVRLVAHQAQMVLLVAQEAHRVAQVTLGHMAQAVVVAVKVEPMAVMVVLVSDGYKHQIVRWRVLVAAVDQAVDKFLLVSAVQVVQGAVLVGLAVVLRGVCQERAWAAMVPTA
jgi:hypothetical protein